MASKTRNNRAGMHPDNIGNFEGDINKIEGTGRRDKRHHIFRLLITEETGSATLESVFIIALLGAILFSAVTYWGFLTTFSKAEEIKYCTLSRMAVDGGLTISAKEELIEKLVKIGAKPDTIQIEGDILDAEDEPVYRPNDVHLKFIFTPQHFNNFPARILIGGSVSKQNTIVREGVAVSEKMEE